MHPETAIGLSLLALSLLSLAALFMSLLSACCPFFRAPERVR